MEFSHNCPSSFSASNVELQLLLMFTLSSTFKSSINMTNVTQKVLETSVGVANDARFLFYLVSPYEAMFNSLQNTPRYITMVTKLNRLSNLIHFNKLI